MVSVYCLGSLAVPGFCHASWLAPLSRFLSRILARSRAIGFVLLLWLWEIWRWDVVRVIEDADRVRMRRLRAELQRPPYVLEMAQE